MSKPDVVGPLEGDHLTMVRRTDPAHSDGSVRGPGRLLQSECAAVEAAAADPGTESLENQSEKSSSPIRQARKGVSAIFDQAVVSGTSFLTTMLVGRWCGADELGLYTLGFSLVILIISIQQALINTPYTVFWRRKSPTSRREFAGSTLIHWAFLSVLSVVALCLGGICVETGLGPPQLHSVLFVLAGAIPFLLLRDFARGYIYAHMRIGMALMLDISVSAIQITGLALLWSWGALNGVSVFVVMGLAGVIAAASWLWMRRHEFAPSLPRARRDWSRSWSFGKWIFLGGMVAMVNSDVFIEWLLAMVKGKAETGIFAACMTLVFFSNPFILGLNQILTPWATHALADHGVAGLRRTVYQVSLLIFAVMSLFCLGLAIWGEDLMLLIYGEQFLGHHASLVAVSGVVLASAVSLAPNKGLWALELPKADLAASLIGLVTTTVVSISLVMPWGVFGAACGLLAGNVAMAAARFVIFERSLRRHADDFGATSPSSFPALGVAK